MWELKSKGSELASCLLLMPYAGSIYSCLKVRTWWSDPSFYPLSKYSHVEPENYFLYFFLGVDLPYYVVVHDIELVSKT